MINELAEMPFTCTPSELYLLLSHIFLSSLIDPTLQRGTPNRVFPSYKGELSYVNPIPCTLLKNGRRKPNNLFERINVHFDK